MEIKGVVSSVAEQLRGMIISGELESGQKMNEIQLSSQFDISRPPLREAFQILEQERLIISIPRRGRYVTEISLINLEEIHQARLMIECQAIDLLEGKRISSVPEVCTALKESLEMPPPPDDPRERLAYLKTTDRFHIKLVESAGNELLMHFYDVIQSNISRYKYMFLFLPGISDALLIEHENVINAINDKAFGEAKDHLIAHLEHSHELMIDRLNEMSEGGKIAV